MVFAVGCRKCRLLLKGISFRYPRRRSVTGKVVRIHSDRPIQQNVSNGIEH